MEAPTLQRLRAIVHMAVPAVIMLVLLSVMLSDRVFAIGRLAGGALPGRARGVMRAAYVVSNAAAVGAAVVALCVQCEDVLANRVTDVTVDARCYPCATLAAVALLLALLLDRAWLNVLDSPGASPGPSKRVVHGAAVVALFMALSKADDPHVFPLMLLAASNRRSGLEPTPAWFFTAHGGVRVACVLTGAMSLFDEAPQRQTAALAILCGALSR